MNPDATTVAAVSDQVRRHPILMDRPKGVTAIAAALFLASAYLVVIALVKIVSPERLSLSWGAPILHGLEVSGPYMFLLAAGVAAIVGVGLLRLKNPARRAAGWREL